MPERNDCDVTRSFNKEKILQDFRKEIAGIKNFSCPTDDEYLMKFLAARKYRLHEAVKLLKKYYLLRKDHFRMMNCICPLNLRELWNIDQQTIVLKHRDALGRKIVLQRNGLWNPDLISFDQVMMVKMYIIEEVLSCPETQRNGIVVLSDDTGVDFKLTRRYIYELSYKRIKLLINFLQGSLPGKFKGFHVCNNTYGFQLVFNLMRPFLKDKIRNRFFIHGSNIQDVHRHISPDILPNIPGLKGKLNLEDAVDKELMENLFRKGPYYKKMTEFGYTDT